MGKFSPVRHDRALMLLDRVMRLSQYSTETDKYFFDFHSFTTGVSISHIVNGETKTSLICWLDADDKFGATLAELEAFIDAEEKRLKEAENNDTI